MLDRQAGVGPHAVDQFPGFGRGSVIGNDEFKPMVALNAVTPEDFFQPMRRVIGADDDGQVHVVFHCAYL